MDKGRLLSVLLLFLALLASLYFTFHFQSKLLFILVTLPIGIAIFFTLTSENVEYIKNEVKNYALFKLTDYGQISPFPNPDAMGRSVQPHWQISPNHPKGGYWQYEYQDDNGNIDYLNLECARADWDPAKDMNQTNLLSVELHPITPLSPSQKRRLDKMRKYDEKTEVEQQLEIKKAEAKVHKRYKNRRETVEAVDALNG